jgi:hypothetical protein
MQLRKISAIAAFVLASQFMIALALVVVAWPKGSPTFVSALNQLVDSSVSWVAALVARPPLFLLANLYNALWCAPIIVLALALREQMPPARHRMLLALISASIAGALFLAGGIIPVVSLPQIAAASDMSASRAVSGIVLGMVLTATSAAGFAVMLIGSAALSTGYLPRLLALLLIVSGVLEICEFAVPLCLVLDPVLGAVWSLWLGVVLLRAKSAQNARAT